MQDYLDDDVSNEKLEWKILRVDSSDHLGITSGSDFSIKSPVPQLSIGNVSSDQGFGPSPDIQPSQTPSFVSVTHNISNAKTKFALPKLNLSGLLDKEIKSEVISARSGFLTAREPSPIVLTAREPTPEMT